MGDFRRTVELLRGVRQGAPAALGDLLERYRDRLLGRVRLMMGEEARKHAESMDFLQGVLLEIARDIDRADIEDEEIFLRWATRIARNNIRDHLRRRRERALESFSQSGILARSGTSPASQAGRREDVEQLVEAMERLSPDHRRVIELRDFDALSYADVAREMEKPSEDAAQMLHARALARLTRELVD